VSITCSLSLYARRLLLEEMLSVTEVVVLRVAGVAVVGRRESDMVSE
jgi:hypothetical protein